MDSDPITDSEFRQRLTDSRQSISMDRVISESLDKLYSIRGAGSGEGDTRHPLEHVSDEAVLLQKRKQLTDFQARLTERRLLYTEETRALQEREAVLGAQRKELDAAKARFVKFVQANNEKKEQALQRMHDEYANEEQLRALQAELLHAQEGLGARLRQLRRELENMSAYEEFLRSVTQHSEEFASADQILHRYASLKATHASLMTQIADEQVQTEEARRCERQTRKAQAARVHDITSETAATMQVLETQEQDTTGLAALIEKQRAATERVMTNIGMMILGIDNLYLRCLAASKIGREFDAKLSLLEKLQVIGEIVGDLEGLVEHAMADGLLTE